MNCYNYSCCCCKGPKGDKGDPGQPGANGANGTNGTNGADGTSPSIGANGNWWLGQVDTGVKADASEHWVDYIDQITADPTSTVTHNVLTDYSYFYSDGHKVKFSLYAQIGNNQQVEPNTSVKITIPASLVPPLTLTFPASVTIYPNSTLENFSSGNLVINQSGPATLNFACTAVQNPSGIYWNVAGEYFLQSPPKV